jgi:N-acetylmuramoyl-L-alanine amidase
MSLIKKYFYIFFSIAFVLAFSPAEADPRNWVEVTAWEAALYDMAGAGQTDNRLYAGAVAELLGEQDNWYQIRMRNGEIGWIAGWLARPLTERVNVPAAFDIKALPTSSSPLYGRVIADRVGFRSIPYGGLNPKIDMTRDGSLPRGCVLKLTDRIKHWFKAQIGPAASVWVYDEALSPAAAQASGLKNLIPTARLKNISLTNTSGGPRLTFSFSQPVPYNAASNLDPDSVDLKFFGIDCDVLDGAWANACSAASGWCACVPGSDTLIGNIPAPAAIAGFDGTFDGNIFNLSVRDSNAAPPARIVIDPGHGAATPPPKGFAEGAHTASNLLEKDVVLLISLRLAEILRSNGFQVYLVREGDSSFEMLDLYKRVVFSESVGADLFISIHANGDTIKDMKGIEVYWYEPQSRPFAEMVAGENAKATGRTPGAALFGSYAVLRQTRAPAILVETGYMTNPAEGKRFEDPGFLEQNAEGIAAGVTRYVKSLARPAR